MFTQCSKCETVFKLSADVLRAAGGQVRCGNCGEVFDALARLAEDANAFTVVESSFDIESRADRILRSPAPPNPGPDSDSAQDFDASGGEIARLEIVDWNQIDSEEDTPSHVEPETHERSFDSSMEYTLPPGELDRIFVESKQQPPAKAETPTPPVSPSDSEAAAASGNIPFEVPDSVRFDILSGMESAQQLRDLARPGSTPGLKRWLAAAMLFALLLAAQIVHHNREYLTSHGAFAAALRNLYAGVGAPVPSAANLSVYQLRQWGVSGDPSADGTLRMRASILNTAAQLAPFPLLRVTLANRFGTHIGSRDFAPSEYLGTPTARYLNPGEQVDATLNILDPGKSAEGFEIDVCLRVADRKISCANDPLPAQTK